MPPPAHEHVRNALWVSIVVTGVLGGIGVVWGILAGSQMILLDGLYAIVGIGVSVLLLRAASLAATPPTGSYPFGRAGDTPLAIALQGLVMGATLVYAAAEAALVIVDGGSDVDAGSGIAYGVIVAVASVIVWGWLRRRAGTEDVLVSEAIAWKVAAWRGVGMVSGFSILGLVAGSPWDGLAPFIDPAMVIITCLLFLPASYRLVRDAITEVMEGVPGDTIRTPVLEAVEAVRDDHRLDEPVTRVTKLGPRLYVEVEVTVDGNVTVHQQQAVRLDLERRLDDLPYDVWLNLEMLPRVLQPPLAEEPA